MTVSAETLPTAYTGDGVTVAFPTVFTFDAASEIQVIERVIATGAETVKTITTHYTVSGGSGSTGTVTAVTAPASTVEWHIYRVTPMTQAADYVAGDAFPAASHEAALDKVWRRLQEMQERIVRCIHIPKSDPTSLQSELPADIARASQYLVFDADGEPTVSAAAVSTVGVSAFMLTLLDDAAAVNARATLDTFEDVFTTRGDILIAGIAGAETRLPIGASGRVVRSDGTDPIWSVLAAADVSYSNTTSGLAATTAQAAIDERITTFTRKTADETATDFSSITAVGSLGNITIPGTPDGARKYRCLGQLLITTSGVGATAGTVKVHVGTNGTTADTVVWEGRYYRGSAGDISISWGFQVTPAASTKLTVSLTDTANESDVRGDATSNESYVEIYRI